MTSRDLELGDVGTDLEVPPPVLFNAGKHHAGALRDRITRLAAGGPASLVGIAAALANLGHGLMDLYTGPLPPRAIAAWVLDGLRASRRLEPAAYRAWLASVGEYATRTRPGGCAWVLRVGRGGAAASSCIRGGIHRRRCGCGRTSSRRRSWRIFTPASTASRWIGDCWTRCGASISPSRRWGGTRAAMPGSRRRWGCWAERGVRSGRPPLEGWGGDARGGSSPRRGGPGRRPSPSGWGQASPG